MSELRHQLRRVLADRHSPEAAAFFQRLLKFVHGRVGYLSRTRCSRLLAESEQEEIIAEVLVSLMQGGLVRFRGDTLNELFAFVRVACDRMTWRVASRRLKERDLIGEIDAVDGAWTRPTTGPGPDAIEWEAESPLSAQDKDYLRALLQAGSKAEFARVQGVSRAAVTQRIQRIQTKVSALGPPQQLQHDTWLHQEARGALEPSPPPS